MTDRQPSRFHLLGHDIKRIALAGIRENTFEQKVAELRYEQLVLKKRLREKLSLKQR